MIDITALTPVNGYLEGGPASVDADCVAQATSYKRDVCKNYVSLNADQIDQRLGGTSFFVTRKYDGELAVLFFDGEQVFTINTGGRVRAGLPCHAEAAAALKAAGVTAAVIPSELYAAGSDGRERVFGVRQALADGKLNALALAPFDILSVDGQPFRASSYADVYQELTRIFGAGEFCRPVIGEAAASKQAVRDIFASWVSDAGAEGLVVRSELPIVYKVKPRHTLDVVVVGFSEGLAEAKGQVRSLLVALMPDAGSYQVVGHVGGGLVAEQRVEFFQKLSAMDVASTYIETDANRVAFHMVRPEMVAEVMINDVLYETTGGPMINPLLEYGAAGYRRAGSAPGVSIIYPVFVRVRDDKAPDATSVRYSQIEEIAWQPVTAPEGVSAGAPAASELLRRQVFVKTLGGNQMVMKFVAWRTNKQASGYPAYVATYVNYSAGRREPFAVETRISSSAEQIAAIMDDWVATNVKKGWNEVVD